MQRGIQTFPQERQDLERGEIPVDNSQFSTFSTVFSTGVFHRWGWVWICIFGSHKKPRQPSPDFLLFRALWILPHRGICAKNQVLTKEIAEMSRWKWCLSGENQCARKSGAQGICGRFAVEKVCGIPQKTPWGLLFGCGLRPAGRRGVWIEKNGKNF